MIINSATTLRHSNAVCAPASSATWARYHELEGRRISPVFAPATGEVRPQTAALIDMGDAPSDKGMAWDQTWRPPD